MKLLGYGGHQSLAIYLRKNNIFNWAENFAEMIGHQKVTNVLFTRFCPSSFFLKNFRENFVGTRPNFHSKALFGRTIY